MIFFEIAVTIRRAPEACFTFLRDKDTCPQKPRSPVLLLEKITPGPVGLGTHFQEVVRMYPWKNVKIFSEITRFEPPEWLDEVFHSSWMRGRLSYHFTLEDDKTRLVQREWLDLLGIYRFFEPIIKHMLAPRLRSRLQDIKNLLESDSA